MLHRSREYDKSLCMAVLLEYIYQMVEFFCAFKRHFYDHGIVACHTVAFYDIRNFFNEVIELLLVFRIDFEVYESLDIIPEG